MVTSRLLRSVFEGFEDAERLTVLDVGPGKSTTIEFLTQFRARIFFADLFDENVSLDDSEATRDEAIEHAEAAFERALGLAGDLEIDVCLFWDYLHCLGLDELQGFSRALQPHLHRGSRGYAFGALHANVELDHNIYSIHDMDQLVRQPAAPLAKHYPHTQKTIGDAFSAFTITRGTLLREGRLELLLEAN